MRTIDDDRDVIEALDDAVYCLKMHPQSPLEDAAAR
jgi:hypothetical protein